MKTIAIMNNKGGVGKTVTAINLADILNRRGYRVVLVDCDGQTNLTQFFAPAFDEAVNLTVADVLTGNNEPLWRDNLVPIRPDLDLLPGSNDLYDLDLQAIKDGASNTMALKMFCDCARDDDQTDFVIFDCPPGFTAASVAALMAADNVVIPVSLDGFSMRGMQTMQDQVASLRRANMGIKIAGILITQWRNTEVVRDSEKLLRSLNVPVFQSVIRRTEKIPESTFMRMPIVEHSKTCAASHDYQCWVDEYLGGVAK